jgi:hypothetical protein
MATLTNTKIKDTYPALLKASDNGVIGASEKVITDGLGNASVLSIGTGSASFSGDVDVTDSILTISNTDESTTLSLRAEVGNSIYSDAPLNIYTVSDDMLFSTGGANSTRMTIDALGDISIEESLSVGGSISSTEDATINGLTVGRGGGNIDSNTVLGSNALSFNTTGSTIVAIGSFALNYNTTGTSNVAVGERALEDNTIGSANVAVGRVALKDNIEGVQNTSIGHQSLSYIEGNSNVAIGRFAGSLVGNILGANKTLGNQNVYIGADTFSAAADTDNEIVIGYGTAGNGSNTATYGNSSITDHYFDGNVRGDYFYGDGSNLTNLTTPNLQQVTDVNATTDNDIEINNSSNHAKVKIVSGNTFNSMLIFGDSDALDEGAIYYDHNSDAMEFRANGNVTRARIDSDGLFNALDGLNVEGTTSLEATNITGNLAVDTDTLYVDAANNRVGIGTSSPDSYLEIETSGSSGSDDIAVFSRNTFGEVLKISREAGEAVLNANSNLTLSADYNNNQTGSNSNVIIKTDGEEAMRIDSSGNVGINQSNPNDISSGATTLHITGQVATKAGAIRLDSSDASVLAYLYPDSTNGFTIAASSNHNMRFLTNATERMRILSSGGITFNGDTSSANALDDYEEGTFTPTMSGYSGVTYSSQIGHYTKIGRFVQVSFYMSISNIGTYTGNSYINGFPFSLGTTQSFATGGQLNIMTALNVTRDEHFGGFYNGTSNLFIYSKSGLTTYNGNNHQAGIYSGTLTYFV